MLKKKKGQPLLFIWMYLQIFPLLFDYSEYNSRNISDQNRCTSFQDCVSLCHFSACFIKFTYHLFKALGYLWDHFLLVAATCTILSKRRGMVWYCCSSSGSQQSPIGEAFLPWWSIIPWHNKLALTLVAFCGALQVWFCAQPWGFRYQMELLSEGMHTCV